MKQQNEKCPETESAAHAAAERPEEMSRRQALAALAKFAACSSPAVVTLFTAEKASAWSPPPPPGAMPNYPGMPPASFPK